MNERGRYNGRLSLHVIRLDLGIFSSCRGTARGSGGEDECKRPANRMLSGGDR